MDKWLSMENLLDRDSLDAETKRIMRKISPSEHVTSNLPPFLLIQGSADTTVPYHLTLNFESELKAHNVSCKFITIEGAQHRIRDWKKYRPGWQNEVAAWLNRELSAVKNRSVSTSRSR
jgi:dipeptidyl aminopeptidase/acylaminoacyl peptidase